MAEFQRSFPRSACAKALADSNASWLVTRPVTARRLALSRNRNRRSRGHRENVPVAFFVGDEADHRR